MKARLVKITRRQFQAIPSFPQRTLFAGKSTLPVLLYLMNLSFLPSPTATSVSRQANHLLVVKAAGSYPSSVVESPTNLLYSTGDRQRVAAITTVPKPGRSPITSPFRSGAKSKSGNRLGYQWMLNNGSISTEPKPAKVFGSSGRYRLPLRITEAIENNCTDTSAIKVDLSAPGISMHALDNSTFFFDKPTYFRYAVEVKANEGEGFDTDALRVTMRYFPRIAGDVPLLGYPEFQDHSLGRNLIAANDCKTCHQLMGRSTVPTFLQISERYWGNERARGVLANKIITGGNGAWGEQVMSAHPQLSKEDAAEIVKYVLSVAIERPEMEIPKQGMEVLNEHSGTNTEARYLFRASYINKGAGTPVAGSEVVVLRPSKVEAERADSIVDMQKGLGVLDHINNKAYFILKNIDLKDIRQLTYYYTSKDDGATIEVHTDAPDGQVVSTVLLRATGPWGKYAAARAAVTAPTGKHDLYFVFVKNDAPSTNLASLDWIKFEGGNEVKRIEKKAPVKTRTAISGARKKMRAARGANKKPVARKSLGVN